MESIKYDVVSDDCKGLDIPEAKNGKLNISFNCFYTACQYIDMIAWRNCETIQEYWDATSMDYTIKLKGKKIKLKHEDYKNYYRKVEKPIQ